MHPTTEQQLATLHQIRDILANIHIDLPESLYSSEYGTTIDYLIGRTEDAIKDISTSTD